jgi:hypothetical protein
MTILLMEGSVAMSGERRKASDRREQKGQISSHTEHLVKHVHINNAFGRWLHEGWLLLIAMLLLVAFAINLSEFLPPSVVQAFGRIY